MKDTTTYLELKPSRGGYLLALLALAGITGIGLWCAYTMEHAGHHITGMNNQVVWGVPHVFALFLIVAASGAINSATLSSVFNLDLYKPYARLSIALAIALLVGGLLVLVLDLGRPDRLVVALTTYNFRSIFTWNIFLYTGFIVLAGVYLWVLMERRFNRHSRSISLLTFAWRIILTSGTGSIFGFLVGRNALDSALLAPLFIAMSLATGTAVFFVALSAIVHWTKAPDQAVSLQAPLIQSMSKLLMWFVVAVAYFSIVHHVTNLYLAEHRVSVAYTLTGPVSVLFWLGYVGIGTLVPIVLLTSNAKSPQRRLLSSSAFVIVGTLIHLYVIVIGAQSTAQRLFPDKIVIASRFGDMGTAHYIPSMWEFGLGIGGIATAALLYLLLLRIFPFTPKLVEQRVVSRASDDELAVS